MKMKCFDVRQRTGESRFTATLYRSNTDEDPVGHGLTAYAAIADLCLLLDKDDASNAHSPRLGHDLTS